MRDRENAWRGELVRMQKIYPSRSTGQFANRRGKIAARERYTVLLRNFDGEHTDIVHLPNIVHEAAATGLCSLDRKRGQRSEMSDRARTRFTHRKRIEEMQAKRLQRRVPRGVPF